MVGGRRKLRYRAAAAWGTKVSIYGCFSPVCRTQHKGDF
jgi:hypothetical protein